MSAFFVSRPSCLRPGQRLGPVLLFWIVAVLLVSFSGSANAQRCRIDSIVIPIFQIRIAPDTPIGATVSDPWTGSANYRCPASSGNGNGVGYRIQGAPNRYGPSATVTDTWRTGLSGIGVRIFSLDLNRVVSTPTSPDGHDFYPTIWGRQASTGVIRLQYQLVKIGHVNRFPEVDGVGIIHTFHNRNTTTNYVSNALGTTTMTASPINWSTCRVTTPDIGVALPATRDAALQSNGGTAGETPFSITLQCDANTNVHVTLTDATTPGNRSDLLTLTPDSTVRGVQLRIRQPSNQAVSFGPDSRTAGNTNQWRVGEVNGTTTIPLRAEYVAVGTVSPGTVRALATFTMSYQ